MVLVNILLLTLLIGALGILKGAYLFFERNEGCISSLSQILYIPIPTYNPLSCPIIISITITISLTIHKLQQATDQTSQGMTSPTGAFQKWESVGASKH
jgi:hypothetical protein